MYINKQVLQSITAEMFCLYLTSKLQLNISIYSAGKSLCPVNWVTFGDSCFEFNTHPAQAITWSQARDACKSTDGAHLASILSSDEQMFVWQQLQDLKAGNIWLGLNDITKEGLFVWSDRYNVLNRCVPIIIILRVVFVSDLLILLRTG